MPKPDIKGLFYITHVDNIKSILRQGILSHALVEERKVQFTPIYDAQIVSNRRERKTPNGKSLRIVRDVARKMRPLWGS